MFMKKNVQPLSHKYVEKGNRFHVIFQLSFYESLTKEE